MDCDYCGESGYIVDTVKILCIQHSMHDFSKLIEKNIFWCIRMNDSLG